jgi:hypothetical protein
MPRNLRSIQRVPGKRSSLSEGISEKKHILMNNRSRGDEIDSASLEEWVTRYIDEEFERDGENKSTVKTGNRRTESPGIRPAEEDPEAGGVEPARIQKAARGRAEA